MIFDEIVVPPSISGEQLDYCLRKGWYRSNCRMMTTDYVSVAPVFHTVHWLRYVLDQYQPSATAKKIKALNADFTFAISPAQINEEAEELYSRYESFVDFDANPTLRGYLLQEFGCNIFNSNMICIRHNGVLIAMGIFDEGDESMAGIINFYDPVYHRYSLGKYLLLLKIEHSLQQNKRYFYPGYISFTFPKFDYKVFADKNSTQVYNRWTDEWLPYQQLNREAMVQQIRLNEFQDSCVQLVNEVATTLVPDWTEPIQNRD
jgi:arginine-tRNA-protein transferase